MLQKTITDGLKPSSGLLWCFYQLFGLSFWRHPFTAEDPLVSKWCNAEFLWQCWINQSNFFTLEIQIPPWFQLHWVERPRCWPYWGLERLPTRPVLKVHLWCEEPWPRLKNTQSGQDLGSCQRSWNTNPHRETALGQDPKTINFYLIPRTFPSDLNCSYPDPSSDKLK